MKNKLLLLLVYFISINFNGQTITNNYTPDRLLSTIYQTRTIDLNVDGIPDYIIHYTLEGTSKYIYVETLGENEILVHDPGSEPYVPSVTSSVLDSNGFISPDYPTLSEVNQNLTDSYLAYNIESNWSTSSTINKKALILLIDDIGYLNVGNGYHSPNCYDYYYCRLKMPGEGNFVYGFIQAFNCFVFDNPQIDNFLYVGGTGYNPTINGTAIINPACDVVANFEPGEQVQELGVKDFAETNSISIKAVNNQIYIINNNTYPINDLNYSLYSITGALISKSIHSINESSQICIPENDLEKGIYIIRITCNGSSYYQKIIL